MIYGYPHFRKLQNVFRFQLEVFIHIQLIFLSGPFFHARFKVKSTVFPSPLSPNSIYSIYSTLIKLYNVKYIYMYMYIDIKQYIYIWVVIYNTIVSLFMMHSHVKNTTISFQRRFTTKTKSRGYDYVEYILICMYIYVYIYVYIYMYSMGPCVIHDVCIV